MRPTGTLVVYSLGERHYGIAAKDVEHVFPAVDVTPLPDSPPAVLGVVDFHGEVLPVIDLCMRCGLGSRETLPSDFFLLTSAFGRKLFLRVDSVYEVIDAADFGLVEPRTLVPGLDSIAAVLEHPDHLVILPDYAALLAEELRSCS